MAKILLSIFILSTTSLFATDLKKFYCDMTTGDYSKIYFELNLEKKWAQISFIEEDGKLGPIVLATAGVSPWTGALSGYIDSTSPYSTGGGANDLLFIYQDDNYPVFLHLLNPLERGRSEYLYCKYALR